MLRGGALCWIAATLDQLEQDINRRQDNTEQGQTQGKPSGWVLWSAAGGVRARKGHADGSVHSDGRKRPDDWAE